MCPFRTDCMEGWLGRTRAQEILTGITVDDQWFACHQTVEHDDEGYATHQGSQCAGSLILLEKNENPHQGMRIAERLGIYDRTKLVMDAPVFDTYEAFIEHHTTERDTNQEGEERDCCSVANPGCEAPAGWMDGGSVVPNLDPGETTGCTECGEPVCENCQRDGVCLFCIDR